MWQNSWWISWLTKQVGLHKAKGNLFPPNPQKLCSSFLLVVFYLGSAGCIYFLPPPKKTPQSIFLTGTLNQWCRRGFAGAFLCCDDACFRFWFISRVSSLSGGGLTVSINTLSWKLQDSMKQRHFMALFHSLLCFLSNTRLGSIHIWPAQLLSIGLQTTVKLCRVEAVKASKDRGCLGLTSSAFDISWNRNEGLWWHYIISLWLHFSKVNHWVLIFIIT